MKLVRGKKTRRRKRAERMARKRNKAEQKVEQALSPAFKEISLKALNEHSELV